MKTYKEYLNSINSNWVINIKKIAVTAKSRTLKATWQAPTIEEMMEDTEENRAFDKVAAEMADEIDREIYEKLINAKL